MTKKEAIAPVVVLKAETAKKIAKATAKPIQVENTEIDADTLIAQFSDYKGRGVASI